MIYHNPTDLNSALEVAAAGVGRIIAGGTDVFPAQQQGQHPAFYLDVTRIAGFTGITSEAGSYRIGAATTWTEITKSNLPPAFDALKQAALEVGSVQIQNSGTLVGNICNASPAADGVPPLLALNARIELASAARGTRVLPMTDFILGIRNTARAQDEIVTAILIPPVPEGACSTFEKLGSRRYLVISISMVAAMLTSNTQGQITEARIAVGSCSPVAKRLPELEKELVGKQSQDIQVSAQHLTGLSPISDVRGNAAYRLDVVAQQCERAILRALA